MSNLKREISGQCICKMITVKVIDPPERCTFCHCENCRKQSSSSGTYESAIAKDKFEVDSTQLKRYSDRNTASGIPMDRFFCGECECPVHSETPTMPGKIIFKWGIFGLCPKVTSEWFCKHRQSWEPKIEGAAQWDTVPE